ncbi:cytochrome P450 [Cytidiella melzeri]|nr:cytochrome P450 [Cytidiella melzeri]
MPTHSLLALIASAVLVATILLARRRSWTNRHRGHTLPPGPKRWPIVGNLYDLPKPDGERPWVIYREWGRIYGDIVFLQVLGTPMLIISSAVVALDLMEKRSSLYSDKPASVMDELTGWDFNVGLMPYGQRWRSIRRRIHQYFNKIVSPQHRAKQTTEVHAFLRRCLTSTGKQLDPLLVRQTMAAIIVDVVYGIKIQGMDDDYIRLAAESLDVLNESKTPGKFWIDFMPFLRFLPPWVPGAAALKFSARWRPVVLEMMNKPFDAILNGENSRDSIARDLISKLKLDIDPDRGGEEGQHARHATGIAYAAGSDTMYSLIQSFFCSMAMHPDIQRKAQEELDTVVGPDRLPTYDDYDSLPYIQAIFMECMRWLPVLPLGVPHRLVADDYYNGYFIPEGTIVFANVWHMLRNPEEYPDPERFYPDRFLKNGILNPKVRDPSTLAFGFGRRICPGRHFAKDNAILTIASVLHVFDVLPSLDEDGKELDPTTQLSASGIISHPDPQHYMLKTRSKAAEGLISATAT